MLITQGRHANEAAASLIRLMSGRETAKDKAMITAAGLASHALSSEATWHNYSTNGFSCELKPASEFRNALSGEQGSRGAFAIPSDGVLDVFVSKLNTADPWRRHATVNTVPLHEGKNKVIAWADDESETGYIRGENDTVQTASTDPKFNGVTHYPKLYSSKRIRVPLELVEDQPRILELVFAAQARRIARIENTTITNAAIVTLPTVSAGAADSLSGDDVQNVLAAVAEALQDSPSFGIMAHPIVARALFKLKDGTSAYHFPNGRPFDAKFVLRNPAMSSTIASGNTSIIAGDFSALSIVDQQTMREILYTESPGTIEANCIDLEAQLRSGFAFLDGGTTATARPLYRLVH